MTTGIQEAYLETEVFTATPQRLRLMLIEAALRKIREARIAWQGNQDEAGDQSASRCREILCELIGSIHQGESPTADHVLGVYLFLFSSLTAAQASRDPQRLDGIIRVLEEERETWSEVCQKLPDRQVASPSASNREELAPRHVAGDSSFSPFAPQSPLASPVAQFSIDA